jgi:anti-sigma B factor antagonist
VQQGEQPEHAPPSDEVIPRPNPYARTYRIRGFTVVELSGEIDLGSAQHLDPHLTAAPMWPAPLVVVLDLGRLEFIDCYGLSLLMRTRRRVGERGGRLRMACGHPQTRKLLSLTGLDRLFQPVRTLEEALRDGPPDGRGDEPPDGPGGGRREGPGDGLRA